MTIKPLDNTIFLRKKKLEDQVVNGIIIPYMVDTEPMEGSVVAVGPGRFDKKTNERIPPVLKIGDNVLYAKWSIKDVIVDGETLAVMIEDDIIGILKDR